MKNPYDVRHETLLTSSHLNIAHLTTLFDKTGHVICLIDIDGRIQYASEASLALFGYSSVGLLGKRLVDIVVPDDQTATAAFCDDILTGKTDAVFQNRCLNSKNRIIEVEWIARWDARQKAIYCIARPLQSKHDSCMLEATNILEHIAEAFYAMDTDWKITYWNKEAEHLLQKKKTEAVGKSLWKLFPDVVGTQIYEAYHKAVHEQTPLQFDFYYKTLSEWFDISIYPNEKGVSVFFRNISERKRTEAELLRLSLIARETVNSVTICTSDNKIIWVNEAFTRLSGYTSEEVIGKSPGSLFDGPDTDFNTVRYIWEQQKKGLPYRVELLNYAKDRRKFWVEVSGQPIFDEQGKAVQFFSIETDITERKLLEAQLSQELKERQQLITAAAIKAQEAERSQVGQELHDNVNQVLTTIKLYTELCLAGIDNSKELMEKSIQLLQTSIDEIRNLSKRLAAPSLGHIKMRDSIKELVEVIDATGKIKITLDTEDIEDVDVHEDLHLAIYRILQEHLTNILKHADASTVKVKLYLIDNELLLKVKDNGKGFDMSNRYEGIGITNMLSRAESLGGILQINSKPAAGCELFGRFPIGQM